MRSVLRKIREYFTRKSPPVPEQSAEDFPLDDSQYDAYAFVIGSVFTYFNDLSPELKYRFVKRVNHFKHTKKFHYIGLEGNEDIATLVSASAIQVTFGLKNYLLTFFKDIYILADAYRMDNEDELYIGHVAPEGIYLSWKHFQYGYANKLDNVNVAVHEMSHALLHNNFFARYGIDSHFRLNYEKFSSTTGPILVDALTRRTSYLRSYAFSNLHEFWAVSVEAFFVNPKGLRENMPDLYEALCRVLNQDPSTKNKLLKTEYS
ncbi:MAG TPA: zinc-dependent peptidase [Chitinophagaceae bacterium]|nr:zinc-dependent peptidase [Chitinophagaceae bacterium]